VEWISKWWTNKVFHFFNWWPFAWLTTFQKLWRWRGLICDFRLYSLRISWADRNFIIGMKRFVSCNWYSSVSKEEHDRFMKEQFQSQINLFKYLFCFQKNVNKSVCPDCIWVCTLLPSFLDQPHGNSLKARLSFIMILLKMAECFAICNHIWWMCTLLYTRTVKANVRNILSVYLNCEIGRQ